ncbi:TIGR03571 family LLM class oxidoreductase [Halobiforma nitratireducens]|uniref:Luciferase-type oxidoreductase n=1 Tax=Halobiforma nitratireducens JCM 10879 TaxID=1227454 RepID=M0LIV8_9EURY|nr:TIGR03571 family LLM class oxidoreductase [Halobiforma nitratireducens]EMA32369.1 luciferase-type oxidoreductase [Halobiforma nitratireducens JCM 10879]
MPTANGTGVDCANAGYRRLFESDELTVGLGFPLTGTSQSTPDIDRELELARHAESLGFDGLWARDVPTYWPAFGDAGQTFDTWPWLSHVAAHTDEPALGTASVVLTLRHPIHVAKSAATVDRLSDGRLVLGVASGDRDPEFPAFDIDREERGELFRERFEAIRTLWTAESPELEGEWGSLDGQLEIVPEPTSESIPMLPTGNARQSREWIAEHGDGWLFYHLPERTLEEYVQRWRADAGDEPYAMAVRVEVADDPATGPEQLHLGYRAGIEWFRDYFARLDAYGVDHVIVSIENEDPEAAMTRFAEAIVAE